MKMAGGIEVGTCDFCGEEKPISRFYVHAKNTKDKNRNGFEIISYCRDCGCIEAEKLDEDCSATTGAEQDKGGRK